MVSPFVEEKKDTFEATGIEKKHRPQIVMNLPQSLTMRCSFSEKKLEGVAQQNKKLALCLWLRPILSLKSYVYQIGRYSLGPYTS